jgi:hypothetical protein
VEDICPTWTGKLSNPGWDPRWTTLNIHWSVSFQTVTSSALEVLIEIVAASPFGTFALQIRSGSRDDCQISR